MSVTHGGVNSLFMMEGSKADPSFKPVVQAIQVKSVGSPSSERYRVVLSDGQHFVQGLLATQLNYLVHEGKLKTNALIQVDEFMNNVVQHRTVIILLRVEVLPNSPDTRIGSPVEVDEANKTNAQPSAPAQPMYNRTNVAAPQMSNNVKPEISNPYGGSSQNNSYSRSTTPAPSTTSSSSAPIVRSNPMGGSPFTLIAALNMYQNRWRLKARVSTKSDIRTWSNARGEGSLFSVELLDSSGVDIRATFFKEAVDKFFSQLTQGNVYSFAGGRLKVANMQYNTCKSNLEITFDERAEIHLEDDGGDIARQNYDFCKISQVEQMEANKVCDILAVVKRVGDPTSLVSKKTGQELIKCDLTLMDDSNTEISLTLWGDKATKAPDEFANTPVAAFRRARISDFGGKSLSLSGSVEIDPMYLPEAKSLQQWWNQEGSTSNVKNLSSSGGAGNIDDLKDRKDIASIKAEHLGHNEKPDWLSLKGTVSFLKKDKEGGAWYPAVEGMYKATQTTDGQWYCEKSGRTYPTCSRRWIFSGTVEDSTASTWVSFFNDQAETMLGMTADEAFTKYMEHNQDQDGYDSVFFKAENTEWVFKCKVKTEIVNDESRVKTIVYAMKPLDYVKESLDMLELIEKF